MMTGGTRLVMREEWNQADDGLRVDLGVIGRRTWWEVPLPPCPDCGGHVVWYEAGFVPGTPAVVRCSACTRRTATRSCAGSGAMPMRRARYA